MSMSTAATVDPAELAEVEEELNRKIAKCYEDSIWTRKKINSECKRYRREEDKLNREMQLSFSLQEDLVTSLSALQELKAAVNSHDLKLLKYQKHTENKSAALDVLQKLVTLRIQKVEGVKEVSSTEAGIWLKVQQENLSKAYEVVRKCVSSTSQWVRIWPILHLWLSGEHASTQSIHSSATIQGLAAELLALNRYASVTKVCYMLCLNSMISVFDF